MDEKLSTDDLIAQAEKAADRLEAANKEYAEMLKKQEENAARMILGGHAEAGAKPKEPTKEEVLKAGMRNYFKGTAIEGAIK
jgi:cell division septum initiation protein DivIVA